MRLMRYHADVRYFCVWSGGFTDDELDQIEFLEKLQQFEKGTVGGPTHKDLQVRDSDVAWIHHDENSNWLFNKASGIISKANYDHFLYDIDGFDAFQLTKYGEDQHYTWHMDFETGWREYERKISFVMMLSDPDDYEGGEFELCHTGNFEDTWVAKPKKGEIIMFASWMPHRVRPVTGGTRKSLVTWVMGKRQ